MCGLVGAAGDMNLRVKDGFKDMLLINQLRGRDATGIFTVMGNGDVDVAKMPGTPDVLFDTKSFDYAMSGMPKILAGHCRSKTVGENSRSNAHPYDYDNVVGMHNGTLRDYYSWSTYNHKTTDSAALFAKIDEEGLEETFKNLDPSSAYALVFWDKRTETLNFIRNEQRPLWFAWTKDKRNIIWASETWFFNAMHRKEELWDGIEEGQTPRSPYFELPVNQLWSFVIDDKAKKGEKVMTLHPIREIKAEKPKVFYRGHPSYPAATGGTTRPSIVSGGQVQDPFKGGLDDDISDVGTDKTKEEPLPLTNALPQSSEDTQTQVGSTTTTKPAAPSENLSSNVSDFRPESMRGTSSSRKILSLRQRLLQGSQQNSNAGPLERSRKSYLTTSEINGKECESTKGDETTGPLVSFRKILGTTYISDLKTNHEWTEQGFENNTKGICSCCNQPIGDLNEVAEFLTMGKFVCTTCTKQPDVASIRRLYLSRRKAA